MHLILSMHKASVYPSVLGSARTGLIFTRIQEETQPGGLTQPGQTEPGIPYHVPSCWVPAGGSWAAGSHSRLGSMRRQRAVRVLRSTVLFCVFSLSVLLLLLLFPLFAVLLNCPYPKPPVFACVFPFSSTPWQGEGRPRGDFVASRSQTITASKTPRSSFSSYELPYISQKFAPYWMHMIIY